MPTAGIYQRGRSLKQMIKDAGLLSAMAMCLDVGCRASWNGSGQLRDLSGNGYHFALGAGAAAPTFVGTVGAQGAAEAFQSDGGDYLTLASGANDTFINSWHKIGGDFSFLQFVSPVAGSNAPMFTTRSGSSVSNNVGTTYDQSTGNIIRCGITNGSQNALQSSTATVTGGQPNMTAAGLQIISNTSRNGFTYINGTDNRGNNTASFTPSSGAASAALRLGSSQDLSIIWANGYKFHAGAIFNRYLTKTELDTLRTFALKRWPTV